MVDYASGTVEIHSPSEIKVILAVVDYVATNSLGLNGGTIKDAAGNDPQPLPQHPRVHLVH